MNKMKSSLAALTLAGGLGLSGAANAIVIGYSYLEVTDLLLVNGGEFVDVINTSASNTSSSEAGFNGTVTGVTDVPTSDDVQQTCFGTNGACGGIAENTFTRVTDPVAPFGDFARGDALIAGNLLINPGASAQTVGEGKLENSANNQAEGEGDAGNNADVAIVATIVASGTGTLEFEFEGTNIQYLFSDEAGSSVNTFSNWAINVIDSNGLPVFEFSPAELQVDRFLGGPGLRQTNIIGEEFDFSFDVDEGEVYEVNISHSSSVDVRRQVPAPATLGLLSLSLLGMGAAARRRRKA